MKKEELQAKIVETKDLSEKLETAFTASLMPNRDLYKWLDLVEKDLNDNLIPERIRDIISHQIDDLSLLSLSSKIHDLTKEEEKKVYENECENLVLLCRKFLQTYQLFKSVGYVEKNTVIIGANGSGKTTLANKLKETLNVEDGIVIPAQKLLLVPTFNNLPSYKIESELFPQYQKKILDDKRAFISKSDDDLPYDMAREYTCEYRRVLALLISERNYKRNDTLDKKKDGSKFKKSVFKTTFDTVVEIWNDLIMHRTMYLDPESIPYIKYEKNGVEKIYEAHKMSDGERIILYLVARVMQAPQNGLIVVDEPEVFLHRTVVDKLWDKLEKEREDCTFIYMTHDLQFAASRVGVKSWIKEYIYPSTWDIQLIDDSAIPEQLLMELLGSCKKVLFCEGTSTTSLDKKIFNELFPDYSIYPLESCKEVVSYTKAFNAIPNTNTKAIGIVDSDFRSKEEIADLKTSQIYTYGVAEIENIFLVEAFLKAFKEYHRFDGDVENIKASIIALLDRNKETQCSNYVTSQIDYHYRKYHIRKGNTKDDVEKNLKMFNKEINIDKWYNDRMKTLNLYLKKKKYDKVIMVYNNKGLHTEVEKEFKITDYHNMALAYLKKASDDVKDELRRLFPING